MNRIALSALAALAVAAMPYSPATPPGGLAAPVVDVGDGRPVDFERAGERARGALIPRSYAYPYPMNCAL